MFSELNRIFKRVDTRLMRQHVRQCDAAFFIDFKFRPKFRYWVVIADLASLNQLRDGQCGHNLRREENTFAIVSVVHKRGRSLDPQRRQT